MIYHRHHIIPRHAGGTDDPSNIVELTIEEHAEAHRKLYEEHGRWQDRIAWLGLAGLVGRDELLLEVARETGKKQRGKPKHTEESKAKLREVNTGRVKSEEERAKIGAAHKGKTMSKETRAKLSAARKGKKMGPLSEEHKASISAAQKGRKLTEEHKAKLKAARKNRIITEETRKKMSAALKGKNRGPLSEEHKAKLSAARKGQPVSEETRAKISAANKGKKYEIAKCPHCPKEGRMANMKRYHFDNCKQIQN